MKFAETSVTFSCIVTIKGAKSSKNVKQTENLVSSVMKNKTVKVAWYTVTLKTYLPFMYFKSDI